MAGSATTTRLLAIATVVALLAVGCTRESPRSEDAEAIDPTLLELVAPVSGDSIRVSERLRTQLARTAYNSTKRCLERHGHLDLPSFVPDRTRFFSFPDAKDLREHGF